MALGSDGVGVRVGEPGGVAVAARVGDAMGVGVADAVGAVPPSCAQARVSAPGGLPQTERLDWIHDDPSVATRAIETMMNG